MLCREFEISRKTGYKIYSRYKDCGLEGLTNRSRRARTRNRDLMKACRVSYKIGAGGRAATKPLASD